MFRLSNRPDLISFQQDSTGDKNERIIQVTNLKEGSILLKAILDPIILRFRFHFESSRPTNRLDKPEWYLNHILDRMAEHEKFIKTEVQELFKLSGEATMDVFNEFTKQLIKLIETKLKRNLPQILEMKPILAHTIESSIRFDCAVKSMYYHPVAIEFNQDHRAIPEWLGTADVILSNPDWFGTWFEAEKEFANDMYFEIISSNDTWEIIEEDRRVIEMKTLGTTSSLRIEELIEQIKEKYLNLPKLMYQIKFLIHLQIPILMNYAERIKGILDGFDGNVNRFIHVVGATDSARFKTYSGSIGLDRLVKVYISSNWMLKSLQCWNDDLFYAQLFENLKQDKGSLDTMSGEVDQLIESIESMDGLDVSLFSGLAKRFEELSGRAEAWIVRQVVQEISLELKPYLLKRWDMEPVDDVDKIEEEMELSNELVKPISIWKSRITYLARTIRPLNGLIKLIRKISKEIESKFISKLIMDPFTLRSISLSGARQIQFDLVYGWFNFEVNFENASSHKGAQIIRLERYFIKLIDCCKLLSFSHRSDSNENGKMMMFQDLVKICFNCEGNHDTLIQEDRFKNVIKDLLNISSLSLNDAQIILKRRPECWKI